MTASIDGHHERVRGGPAYCSITPAEIAFRAQHGSSNSARTGIELRDLSDGNLIEGNTIEGAGAPETHGGGIFLHGASHNRIDRNRISDTAGMGIGIANWDASTINLGNDVTGNALHRTNQTATDSGAIYLLGRSQRDTGTRIADNWIEGTGGPDRHSVGIYLDDSMSGVEVSGNVVRGAGSDAVQIHGGSFNRIVHNILDLGDSTASAVLFQAAPADTGPSNRQEGNEVRGNVILSTSLKPKLFFWIEGGQPDVWRNLYFNPTGASMAGSPPVLDREPVFADPSFTDAAGGDYSFGTPAIPFLQAFPPLRATREPMLRRQGAGFSRRADP